MFLARQTAKESLKTTALAVRLQSQMEDDYKEHTTTATVTLTTSVGEHLTFLSQATSKHHKAISKEGESSVKDLKNHYDIGSEKFIQSRCCLYRSKEKKGNTL